MSAKRKTKTETEFSVYEPSKSKAQKELVHNNKKYIYQREKIKFDLNIRENIKFTDRQQEFINLALDKNTKVLIVKGPAGASKTFLSIYCALQLLNRKSHSDILLLRTLVESSPNKLGFLPGSSEEKMSPFLEPFYDKLEEFLCSGDIKKLIQDERIIGKHVGFLRGLSWNAKVVILDEAQNAVAQELKTFLTRIGEFCKVFVLADPNQSDINGKSGFNDVYNMFQTENAKKHGIFTFELTEEDIVRSELTKFIVNTYEEFKNDKTKTK